MSRALSLQFQPDRLCGLALLLGLFLTAGCGGSADRRGQALAPEPRGLIAYAVGSDGGKPRLSVRDLRTGVLRLVTEPRRGDLEILGWSRDGRTLRYARHLAKGGLDLFVVDVEKSAEQRIRHNRVDGMLAPSERWVAVGSEACKYDVAAERDIPGPLRIRVFAALRDLRHDFPAVDGLVTTSTAEVVQWAPDETKLAYEVTSYSFSGYCGINIPSTSLYEARIDGSQRRRIAAEIGYSGSTAGYSLDSRYFAFIAGCDPEGEFCEKLLVWDGHKNEDVTPPHHAVSYSFVWSDPSKEIVFVTTRLDPDSVLPDPFSNRPRTYRILAAHIGTKTQRELAVLPQGLAGEPLFVTFIQPVQRALSFFSLDSRLLAASLDGGRPLWRAPWRLESNWSTRGAAIFLR